MSLTKEQVVANTKKYFDTAKKNGFLTPELEKVLDINFMKAPASTMQKLNNAFEGGLVDHILRIMRHAYHINNGMVDGLKVPLKSLIKVVYLHQIGKTNLYEQITYKSNIGKVYDYNDDITSMSVGERSVFHAVNSGIELTDDEYIAIINHDKSINLQAEWYNSTVGDILKCAVRLAIMEEKFLA